MIALIDGDILIFRTAAATNEESLGIAKARLNELVESILFRLNTREYIFYISGSDNFRYKANPEYKANRREAVDPVHREALKIHAIEVWNAQVVHGMEADDALAMEQMRTDPTGDYPETVIVTIDKDLNMVPGPHFNFVKDTLFSVSHKEGTRFFWEQLLIGDKADNIIGIDRIGPVRAKKALQDAHTEDEMFDIVRSIYNDDERLLMNARCLWMCRKEPDEWRKTEYAKALGMQPEPVEYGG